MSEPRPVYVVAITQPEPVIIEGEWEPVESNEISLLVLIDEYRAGLWSPDLLPLDEV